MNQPSPVPRTGSGSHNCPYERDPAVRNKMDETVKQVRQFARTLVVCAEKLSAADRESEFHAMSESTRVIFQKWTLEILYTLGVSKVLRFGALKTSLPGISSRTLSLKLDELERLGFVSRKLYDERPIRVEYSLTEKGMILAALTTPLVAYLHRALESEGEPLVAPTPVAAGH